MLPCAGRFCGRAQPESRQQTPVRASGHHSDRICNDEHSGAPPKMQRLHDRYLKQLCAVRALTLGRTVVKAADMRAGEVSQLCSSKVCVRRSMLLSDLLSPSSYPGPHFIKHTLPFE